MVNRVQCNKRGAGRGLTAKGCVDGVDGRDVREVALGEPQVRGICTARTSGHISRGRVSPPFWSVLFFVFRGLCYAPSREGPMGVCIWTSQLVSSTRTPLFLTPGTSGDQVRILMVSDCCRNLISST